MDPRPDTTVAASAASSSSNPSRAMIAMYLAIVALLVAIGVTMVFSASSIAAGHDPKIGDSTFFYQRQLIFLAVGLVAMAVMAFVDYRKLLKFATSGYVMAAVLLLAVMIIGTEVNNAKRWIRIGPMSFQPSEFAKVVIVVAAAAFAASRANRLATFRHGFVPACLLVAPMAGLIIIQPDLGTALFVTTIGMGVLIVAGMRLRHVGLVAGLAMPLVIGAMFLKFSHVQDRILVFMDPEADLRGKGHQIYQSLIALGSGGFWGKGLGESTQKLFFLPEEHTDFIFAIVVEELGFIGGAVIIMLFAALAYAGSRIAKHARDLQGTLIVFGITAAIVLQAAMNIAVVTASVPTKGISLPFISFGGTGLVIALAGVGIVINVARQSVTRREAAKLRLQTWDDSTSNSNISTRSTSRTKPQSGAFLGPVPTAIPAAASGAFASILNDESQARPRVATRRKLHLSSTDLDDITVDPDLDHDTDPMPDMKVSLRSNRVAAEPYGGPMPTNQSARIDAEGVGAPTSLGTPSPESELADAVSADSKSALS